MVTEGSTLANNADVLYMFHTGAAGADKTQFQQLVTLDMPWDAQMVAATTGRQGAYFLANESAFGSTVGSVYVLPLPGGTTDIPYEKAPKKDYIWRSKQFVMPGRTTWAAAKVVHKCGCVRMRLYIDGCLAYDDMVIGSQPFRLPSQLVGTTLEIELIGSATVDEVHVASSIKELLSNE